ncbi:hypothetical protein [Nostoc sp.]|uniref:hypothetical protein n=1 Tax=Nostoc sp. TaxID=1180 RepID=UPI002FFB2BED
MAMQLLCFHEGTLPATSLLDLGSYVVMDLSKLSWIKNVKHKDSDKPWAYERSVMQIPEARIFCLNWRDPKDKTNAEKPLKDDLMLLLQKAKVTHLVEFVDNKVYGNNSSEWGIYRVVKALWMPPENVDWEKLPHQKDFFGFDYVVGDGAAHNLAEENKMHQFHQYWDKQGGLKAFQKQLENRLTEISSTL